MAKAKKLQLIGLDIGSHSIKLVELDQKKNALVLLNFGMIGLPRTSVVEGTIKETEIVASAIGNLVRNLRVRRREAALAISGYPVIVKRIGVEAAKGADLETLIQEEAEQYIPFDLDEVNLDYDILPAAAKIAAGEEQEAGGGLRTEVMLAAVRKDVIDDYVAAVRLAGLNAAILDVDAFAIQNAFEHCVAEQEGCYALVNLGAEELGINAVSQGSSLFTRESSYGGSQITEAIAQQFGVSYEEAERIKLGGAGKEHPEDRLQEIFQSAVTDWIEEIKRAIDYVSSLYPQEVIEKIFVSGGSCRVPGFQKLLEQETGMPVMELDAFANLDVNKKRFDPDYLKYMGPQAAVAVGLALRTVGDK